MGHQAGQGYCLQSLDPTSMSEGLIFLPVHMASRDSQHFVISHPTAIIFFFKHQNTLRYIHMQWPHFWVKERQRLGYPGLAFSWSTFCTVVPFLSSSLFYLLWFPSGLLLCPLIFFILMPECLSLSLKAVVSNKPSLVFFFFFLSCSVILSFLFHNPLSEFLLSIWATWSPLFLEWRQKKVFVVVVQSWSHAQLFATPWTAARQAPLSFTISQSLLRFMSIGSVMPSNHLILCRPLLFLPLIFPSFRVFSNEKV